MIDFKKLDKKLGKNVQVCGSRKTTCRLSSRGASIVAQELIALNIIRPVEAGESQKNVLFEVHEILHMVCN